MNETGQQVGNQTVIYRAVEGHLSGLTVGNFKAFGDTQRMPLRPITLVYGANSAGKSSLLHSLLFAKHILETGELDVVETRPESGAVDLGGFHQFVHGNDTGRDFSLGWQVPLARARCWDTQSEGALIPTFLSSELMPSLDVTCSLGLEEERGLDEKYDEVSQSFCKYRQQRGLLLRQYHIQAGEAQLASFSNVGLPTNYAKLTQSPRAFTSSPTRHRRHTLMSLDAFNLRHPACSAVAKCGIWLGDGKRANPHGLEAVGGASWRSDWC